MAIRTDFTAGEVLAAADLNDTFGAKANLASPTFTGTPAGPTAAAGTNTTQLATTAFAQGAGGLVHIATGTASAASTLSVNDCFSSTYANYRILISLDVSVNDAVLNFRFRSAGADNSNSNYWAYGDYPGSSGGAVKNASNLVACRTESPMIVTADIANPNVADYSNGIYAASLAADGVVFASYNGTFGFATATVFTGFTLFPGSGTITGTVRVYGYKNS